MQRGARYAFVGSTLVSIALAASTAAAEPPPACTTPKTTCAGHNGYYAPTEDIDRLTAVADPVLKEVRACLDANAAKHVVSALIVRWDSDGKPVDVRIDAPGYESLPCVQKAQTKLKSLQNPRETMIRCEYGCPHPEAPKPAPAPAPAPAPVVVPAPAAKDAPPATTAEATPAPPTKAEAPQREVKVWYGYQTLTADAFTLGATIGGVAGKSRPLGWAGAGAFVLATPIVHMAHGNIGPGFGSFALRLLVPLAGVGIGALVGLVVGAVNTTNSARAGDINGTANAASDTGDAVGTGAIVGGLLGAGLCSVVDAAGLAYTKEKVDARPSSLRVAPAFAVHKDDATIGLAGRF